MAGSRVTVVSVREVGPGTVALEIETPPDFDPAPGQFILVRAAPAGEELARHYTLSSPTVEETFEVTVRVDPDGDLSPWLASLDGGESIHVEGPFGTITYDRDDDVVAAAGGPGVGPAIAVAEAAHDAGHEAVVIYQDDQVAHRDRLTALEDGGATVVILDDGADDALHRAIEAHHAAGDLYAFGFEPFVRAVHEAIESAGGDPKAASFENFG